MSVKQISVFLENKPGALMGMTDLLAASKIDMRALSLAESSDFGIARIIVDDVYAASDALKAAGFIFNITPFWACVFLTSPADCIRCCRCWTRPAPTWSICTPSWAAPPRSTPI